MRILHVTDTFLPVLGGIELAVNDLADRQRGLGHGVTVLTRTPSPEPEDAQIVRSSLTAGRLAATIEDLAPDVVHCHSSVFSPLAWRAADRAARTGRPTLITMHSLVPQAGPVAAALRAGFGRMPGNVQWNAVSTVAAVRLRELTGRAVSILPNGIDLDLFGPVPAEPAPMPTPMPTPTIVSTMRLASRKRPLALIEALDQVNVWMGEAPWQALIIGDGPQRPAVTRAIRRADLSHRVHLTGTLDRESIRRQLTRADVYLAPARLESFGIAALEARCCGVPIVAMRNGGVGEFVGDGRHGYLAGNDAEFAAHTFALLSRPGLRTAIRRQSLAEPPGLGWSQTLARCFELYAATGADFGPAPDPEFTLTIDHLINADGSDGGSPIESRPRHGF
jgi:glycosyltransferase involved in cell wall biosynthesis